jgi:small ligand-binding sensory domain FIST
MPFAAAVSTHPDTERAAEEVSGRALEQLAGAPDLAVLFFSPHHLPNAGSLAAAVQQRVAARSLIGCCGESVIGNDLEIEGQPAVSLWLGRWPEQVGVEAFHLVLQQTPDGTSLLGWPDGLLGADPTRAVLLTLGDPFAFPVDQFFEQLAEDCRGLRVLGGMASGSREPGPAQLLLNYQVLDEGAVGVLLSGPVRLRSIVSQGCRPVGRPYVITKAEQNIILELGGRAPLLHLQELWPTLSPQDQQLFQRGLHVGLVINEYQGKFRRGDFLVRNVIGLDQQSGALGITDRVRVGQTVQFHVRDADTADEDLHALLQHDSATHPNKPSGALVFSCNGRGTRLFAEAHHDARAIRAEVGPIPLAGFFAAGELGPVGGQNFIHGFTASVALFE